MTSRCFDPAHRSYSTDRSFDECAFRWHAQAHLGVRSGVGPEAVVGSVVDEVLCAHLDGTIADTPDVETLLRRKVERDGVDGTVYPMAEMAAKADALIRLGVDEVLPTYPKVHGTQVELHYRVDDVVYHAHLDVVFDDGSFVDWKTSERRLEADRAHKDVQLTHYAAAMVQTYGHLPPSVGLDGLIYANPPKDVLLWRPSARKPWWDSQRSTRTLEQVNALLDDLRRREAARRWMSTTGIYLTQGRSAPYACKGCPAIDVCPSWVGFDTGTRKETDVNVA